MKGEPMSLKLPAPIETYIAAENAGDVAVLSNCFAENAVVQDEGRTIRGLAAIQQWKRETKEKYHHSVEPLACAEKDAKIVVKARLTGDFPGSPVDVHFIFGLEGDRIGSLEIRP